MSARLRRQRRSRQSSSARAALLTIGVLGTLAVIAGLSAVGYVASVAESAPDLRTLEPQDPGRNSVILASNGDRLGVIQNDVIRFVVPGSQIPRNVRNATVATEDRRFYQHQGVDFEGIVRAAMKNFSSGETIEGGSTLTMQLIRTLYISNERTLKRKIREAKLAEELEEAHPGRKGKEWILSKYLNSVSYGTNGGQTAVGIQAAARAFFDKSASKLKLHEAALLAGLPQAPSQYNPFKDPDLALARRNDVLRRMADQGYITQSEAFEAQQRGLGVEKTTFFREKRESFFFDYVTDELIQRYGVKKVRSGGLRVKTTIDLDMQDKARAAISKSLSFDGAPSSAIVSIDPRNGYIRAMASSAKYKDTKFNLAAQGKRQPGSAFKVMALVAAVRQGIDPKTKTYVSRPLDYTDKQYGPIKVKTYSNKYPGSMNLVKATTSSDNSVYTQLALDIGPKTVAKAAKDLGIRSKLQGFPSEVLGGLRSCCSPLEMANAYATIVNGGWRNRPKSITQVRFPDGKVDDLSQARRHKAFSSGAMNEVVKILQMNIQSGTGGRAKLPNCKAAGGKTGTTDENRNAWFVGFTPKLSTSTWVGFPRANIKMSNLFNGGPVDGGTFPAQIWGDYMKTVSDNCGSFRKPEQPFKPKVFKPKARAGLGNNGSSGGGQQTDSFGNPIAPGDGTANQGDYPPLPQDEPIPPPPPPPPTGGEGFDPDAYNTPVPSDPEPPPP